MKTFLFLLLPLIISSPDSGEPRQSTTLPGDVASVLAHPANTTFRDEVKQLIAVRCGSCHTSTLATAKPGALKIFDLVRSDWPSPMSERQFAAFRNRLNSLEKHEQEIIGRFIALELSLKAQTHHTPVSGKH